MLVYVYDWSSLGILQCTLECTRIVERLRFLTFFDGLPRAFVALCDSCAKFRVNVMNEYDIYLIRVIRRF